MAKSLRQHERFLARRQKPIESAIRGWMLRRAREEAAKAIDSLTVDDLHKTGESFVWKVSKADQIDQDLIDIFVRFGIVNASDAAKMAIMGQDIEYILDPNAMLQYLESSEFKLKWFFKLEKWATKRAMRVDRTTKELIKESIRRVISDASSEVPKPGVGEIARRIRTQFHGEDPSKRIYAWSPERAALIARTETNIAEHVGTHQGYKVVDRAADKIGYESFKRWLAKTGDRRSGERRHYEMDGVEVPMGEKFTMPDGEKMEHPGDPSGAVHHLVSCRCTYRLVFRKKAKK